MRLAWLTDIHLNFVRADQRIRFLDSLLRGCDAVVITGDIAESRDVGEYLGEMERVLQRPIYFVLGNHDFYGGSISPTREAVARLAADSTHLVYLTAEGVVELSPRTALVGHDGWADAALGDFQNSNVILNDYLQIRDLVAWREDGEGLDKDRLADSLGALGSEAARHFEKSLTEAAETYSHVIAATHVPPFREAAWYEGRISDDQWLPHFSCKAVGEAMMRVMMRNPQCQLLVLCGHTHGGGEALPLDNLRVLTGAARYGEPRIREILTIE